MGLRKPKSIKHNGKSLTEILEAHERFFTGKEGGARADLTGADLSNADLSEINLTGAILRNANLHCANGRAENLRSKGRSEKIPRRWPALPSNPLPEELLPSCPYCGDPLCGGGLR